MKIPFCSIAFATSSLGNPIPTKFWINLELGGVDDELAFKHKKINSKTNKGLKG